MTHHDPLREKKEKTSEHTNVLGLVRIGEAKGQDERRLVCIPSSNWKNTTITTLIINATDNLPGKNVRKGEKEKTCMVEKTAREPA